MKFLCIGCDEQMTLVKTLPPEEGSGISIIYGCPSCSQQIGMLTNALETQVVGSMGVRIGASNTGEAGAETADDGLAKCPFGDVVREMQSGEAAAEGSGPPWTVEAISRLENIPEFVRPMAKQGIEGYAKSNGYDRIDEHVIEKARKVFGM